MSTHLLHLGKEAIDEATSGAYQLLRDVWGYTGDAIVRGKVYADEAHFESGHVSTYLDVTGKITGWAHMRSLEYMDCNVLSATGSSHFANITGDNYVENLRGGTGWFETLTGINADGLFNLTSTGTASNVETGLYYTGNRSVEFRLNGLDTDFKVQHYDGDGDVKFINHAQFLSQGDNFQSHYDFYNVYVGAPDYFNIRSGNFRVVDGDIYAQNEIFISGQRIQAVLSNDIIFNVTGGALGDVFQNKGDILVGTGASGAKLLPVGSHGQLLQVDTGNGDYGLQWIDSGAFTGAGAGLEHWTEVGSTSSYAYSIFHPTGSKGSVISTNSSAFVVKPTNAQNGTFGTKAICIENVDTTPSCHGTYGLMVGHNNTIYSDAGPYTALYGASNQCRDGNYNVSEGFFNDMGGSDYSFVGGYSNTVTGGNADVILGAQNTYNWNSFDWTAGTVDTTNIVVGKSNSVVMANATGASHIDGLNISIGSSQTIQNTGSILIGRGNSDSNSAGSIRIGQGNSQHGSFGSWNSCVLGFGGRSRREGEFVESSSFGYQGQKITFGGSTSAASPTEIFLAGRGKRLQMSADSTIAYRFLTVAQRTDGTVESAGYEHYGVIQNDGGTTTSLSATNTALGEDDSSWGAIMEADDTNDCLKLTVSGAAGKDVEWRTYGFYVEYY